MSKFKDKLTRLHTSRVRALETDGSNEPRVFVADVVETPMPSTPSRQAHVPPQPQPPRPVQPDSAARQAVRQQLEIGRRLGTRATPKRVVMKRELDEALPAATRPPPREPESDNPVGERLADLRLRAEALIAVGGLESALSLLHEMAALSPTHPYPLTQLVRYWQSVGNDRLAELYAGRLAAVAPY